MKLDEDVEKRSTWTIIALLFTGIAILTFMSVTRETDEEQVSAEEMSETNEYIINDLYPATGNWLAEPAGENLFEEDVLQYIWNENIEAENNSQILSAK